MMKRTRFLPWVVVCVLQTPCTMSTGLAEQIAESAGANGAKAGSETQIDPSLFVRKTVEFDVRKEPRSIKLALWHRSTSRAIGSDPDVLKKILTMQYTVDVQLRYPYESAPPYGDFGEIMAARFLTSYTGQSLLANSYSGIGWVRRAEYFNQLAARIPKDSLPAASALSFYTTDASDGLLMHSAGGRTNDDSRLRFFEFEILAPTEDKARELAQTLLVLFDWGLTRPLQVHLHSAKREAQQVFSGASAELEKAQAEMQRLEEQGKAPEEVSPASVADLKTQLNLLSVDVAGTEARIGAATRLLGQENQLRKGLVEQVEGLKIAAEIELAGLKARQKALDLLISKGTLRQDLQSRLREIAAERDKKRSAVSNSRRRLEQLDELIKRLGPFELVGGKVAIRPIKWDNAPSSN